VNARQAERDNAAMETLVALLRGINVGGRRTLPMAELASLLSSLGLEDVTTYIQSGNAVFRAPADDVPGLAAVIERRLAEATGLDAGVLIRTPAELAVIASGNPFANETTDVRRLHVVFLDREPDGAAAARLDPQRSPPDELHLRGTEVYLHLPNGFGRSKLTVGYFERMLGVRATARNWNTVTRLLSLAADAADDDR
jgi:uncharacterized protein (DUF1697 family)